MRILVKFMVGVAGLEPATSGPPDRCATKLRYTPYKYFLKNSKRNKEMRTIYPRFCFMDFNSPRISCSRTFTLVLTRF